MSTAITLATTDELATISIIERAAKNLWPQLASNLQCLVTYKHQVGYTAAVVQLDGNAGVVTKLMLSQPALTRSMALAKLLRELEMRQQGRLDTYLRVCITDS